MPRTVEPPTKRRRTHMSRWERGVIGLGGLASWGAGAVATFRGGEGSGAVALIGVGAIASVLALIGHWPTRVVVSGSEMSWDDIVDTVDQQIEAAEDAGEGAAVKELEELRRRLSEAQRTGASPRHPAAEYDDAVMAALRRALPGVTVTQSPARSREVADFVVTLPGRGNIFIETKYKLDPTRAFEGSTLKPLVEGLGERDRLLVITNSLKAEVGETTVTKGLGQRGRVVTWLGPHDDAGLQSALAELMSLGAADRR